MDDVFPANHRHHVGWVKNKFLVHRVRLRSQTIELIDIDGREGVGFGELQSQLLRESLVDRVRREEIQLVGEAHASFVDGIGTDGPDIGNLRIVAANVAMLAIDRANTLVQICGRVVAAGFRSC